MVLREVMKRKYDIAIAEMQEKPVSSIEIKK